MKFNPNIISRTSYTFFESILNIDDLINFSIKNNFSDVWIVEKNIMYSTMEFYNKSIKNNLDPKVGLQINFNDEDLILFAINNQGYKDLIKISSKIMTNLIIDEDLVNSKNLIKISLEDFSITSYYEKDDLNALKTFSEIGNKKIILEKNTFLKNSEEFINEFGIEKYNKIIKISNSISLKIDKNSENILPNYIDSNNKIVKNPDVFLKNLLNEKIKEYLKLKKINNKEIVENYLKRLKYEFDVIKKMNYSSYFLIVWDFVKWAKNNNIMVGPGRGSSSGSLISFLLNITIFDPIKNNLIFERFLNPERISLPDIDIDFEDKKREKVIDYIVNKYGKDFVSSIITFQTLRAKMSFKDISRFYNLPANRANEITKLIIDNQKIDYTFKKSKNFRFTIESDELLYKIYNESKIIEGLPRQHSTHAAGIVLSKNKIIDSVPIQNGYSEHIKQTQYSMNYLEENGLLKIDILGLRNLSFLKDIINLIKKRKNKNINLYDLKFDDPKVFKLLSDGKTCGIFQLESNGMKTILKKLKPNNFEDIVATISLYRPGPMEQINDYIERKNNPSKIKYFDDLNELEPILKKTYGIIVYQEQIMEIVQKYSSFSFSKADILRKAIGKKNEKELINLKEDFIKGAIKNNHSLKNANKIFDLIFKFSDYGFNRSHAYAYAAITYWLSWLKTYYSLEFISCLLSSVTGNTKKTIEYINESNLMNIKILKPNINNPSLDYEILNKNEIQLSLLSIKGIGINSLKLLISEFNKGKFLSYKDFVTRVVPKGIKKNYLELLIKSGALDVFEFNRNELLESLDEIFTYLDVAIIKTDKKSNEYKIDQNIDFPIIEKKEKKNYSQFEIDAFSFNLEENPFNNFISNFNETFINEFTKLIEIEDIQDKEYKVIGTISSIRELKTRNNSYMLFANLKDINSNIRLVFWPQKYSKFKEKIFVGKNYIVKGKMDLKRDRSLIVDEIKEIKK